MASNVLLTLFPHGEMDVGNWNAGGFDEPPHHARNLSLPSVFEFYYTA